MTPIHKRTTHLIIGWKESVNFPEWGISNLVAKIDTGAKGSALDVKNIHEHPNNTVSFEVVLHAKDREFTQKISSPIVEKKRVKSSTGHVQERYKVSTIIKMGKKRKRILVSLVCRKSMLCRMLLGRDALGTDFFVNPGKKYIIKTKRKTRKQDALNN